MSSQSFESWQHEERRLVLLVSQARRLHGTVSQQYQAAQLAKSQHERHIPTVRRSHEQPAS